MPSQVTGVRSARRAHRATARSRTLSAFVLTVAGLTGLAGAFSSPALADQGSPNSGPGADDGAGQRGTMQDLQKFKAGRYIVMMAAPSAAGYTKTRARGGRSFDARTSAVKAYSQKLETSHQSLAKELGFKIQRNYTIAANGFIANLSAKQATELATDRDVLLVEKDSMVHADTWNTPKFLGLSGKNGAWAEAGGPKNAGEGIVVGVIDTGVWPESKSFAGSALTSTPKTKWDLSIDGTATRMEKADGSVFTGECQVGEDFTVDMCNTKLISARYYVDGFEASDDVMDEDYVSPRDGDGHGTHTASTAAGNKVDNVKVEDVKFGSIQGMAPGAKIAVYKALWETPDGGSGTTSDLVAAIDQAVADGVDVINYSISGPTDTTLEAAEIAFEGAAEAGIFVAASAGNEGPGASTVAHNSPWLTTVAANTHHNFENTVVLGNGTKLVGASISKTKVASTKLVDALAAGNGSETDANTALCAPDSLDPEKVADKIVVCERGVYDRVAKSAEVLRAGGKAMILANVSEGSLDADFHSVPTIHISDKDTPKLLDYMEEAGTKAKASFALGNITKKQTPLPQIAGFSSRGPAASDNSDLLKPDISAPGVSILAAVAPPTNSDRNFDLYSGTSMSAPHIAGLAAFMLGLHPRWAPMKVKSAMMTTATDLKGKESKQPFSQGAGQVAPRKMLDPGLFVLSDATDWRGYLSGLGLDTGVDPIEAKDLNVPSLAQGYVMSSTELTRTFTSDRAGSWKVAVDVPGFKATASIKTLVSKRKRDLQDITFSFQRTTAPLSEWAFGHVTLTGPTTLRMPVALRPVSVKAPLSVTGMGADGSVEVPITGGSDTDLAISAEGLVKGQAFDGDIAVGDYALECVTIGEGNKLAQFDLNAPDATSDLDMYIYASESCNPDDITGIAGEAATPSAGETFTLDEAEAGTYLVEVDAFSAGDMGDPVPYSLRVYDLGGTPSEGSPTVTPNPVPIQVGVDTSFDVAWTGLDPDAHYFGILSYAGSPNDTFVYVDTTTP